MRALTFGTRPASAFDCARVDAFIENGPKAVDFFASKTAVRFDMPMVFPDYHAEAPAGRKAAGRWWLVHSMAASWATRQDARRRAAGIDRLRNDAGLW